MLSVRALAVPIAAMALAGCAVEGGPAPVATLVPAPPPVAQQQQGVQVASLKPVPGIIRQGTVLWHREAAAPEDPASLQPAVEKRLNALNQTIASLQSNQKQMQQQALGAVNNVAQLARQSLQANAQKWDFATRQLAELQNHVNTATRESREYTELSNNRVMQHTQQLAKAVSTTAVQLAQLQENQLKPEQVAAIAGSSVREATPQFRAIALQSIKDSGGYIRSVARDAVQDSSDPAMQAAMANAARSVIMKDNKVVFAIRKAVAEQLQSIATRAGEETAEGEKLTRLGPDHARTGGVSDTVQIDPANLKIGALKQPGTSNPAVDAMLAALEPASGPGQPKTQTLQGVRMASLAMPHQRRGYMDIRQYKVVLHEDNQTLGQILAQVLHRAMPFTGPWEVRWQISKANRALLNERFSIDVETNFDQFVSYLSQYIMNDRGVKLSFSLFDTDRVIVVSD